MFSAMKRRVHRGYQAQLYIGMQTGGDRGFPVPRSTAYLRQLFGYAGSAHPGATGTSGPQDLDRDSALFPLGPGTVAECGQAAGWDNL